MNATLIIIPIVAVLLLAGILYNSISGVFKLLLLPFKLIYYVLIVPIIFIFKFIFGL